MDPRPRLEDLARRFLELGSTVNLSAARDFDTLWERHILDSLALLTLPEIAGASALLDLGTGGGLPGLPLALARPDLTVTLVDSIKKKLRAVDTLIDELGITNARTIAARAEDLGRSPDHRQRYPVVVARAVARLATLLEYAAPLTALKGAVVAIKGPDPTEEVAEAEGARRSLRLAEPRIVPYSVAGLTFTHVIYPVTQYVPRAYPRGQGLPSRRPLAGPPPRALAPSPGSQTAEQDPSGSDPTDRG